MNINRLLGATALVGILVSFPVVASAKAAAAAKPASAVDEAAAGAAATGESPAATPEADADKAIVITGSRIRRPNDESTVPITTVTAEQILSQGRISIGDVLNDLPQLRSSFSSQNSTSGLGTRGVNFLDLRGLGRSRTLVLINGRRHVSADIINNGSAVDINTFPTDLIERVDIVTGGNSSIYGSDAIAGVVNFITKQDYEGLKIRLQSGISYRGDAGNQLATIVAGKNFADGRGNVAVNLEYAHQDDYYGSNRTNLRQNDGFVTVDTDPAGTPNGSDGVPDAIFLRDIRSSTISRAGQIGIRQPATGALCGVDSVGSAFTCGYIFNPDGTLTPQTGLRVGLGPNGSYLGGNGDTRRLGNLLALQPNVTRYAANLIGHFEITPAIVPFVEAKYVRTDSFGTQSGPFFSQGTTLGDGIAIAGLTDRSYGSTTGLVNREGIRIDNPYLTAQARTLLTQQLTAAVNANINPNTGAALSAANRTILLNQLTDGSFRFSNRKNYEEFPFRDEQLRRETYRVVAGVRGQFNDDWNYEVSVNYGKHTESNVITGNVNTQRFLLAQDTVVSGGQIVCRSRVDARYAGTDRAGNPAQLAADIAACVPLNPFGFDASSQGARDYVLQTTTANGRASQLTVTGFVSGDSSQLFELPGGPIGFSFGGEYRRETLKYTLDPITQAGYAFYNAIPSFNAPAFEVKEGFAEVNVPLIKDVFLLKELTLSGSARVASYGGAVGTQVAYSGGADWRPVDQLRFRGTYSRSVRAPYLGELYSPQSQNFTPAPADPCSARNIGTGSSTRAANCAAAGRPANYDYVYTSSLQILSGGNPNLSAETSTSYTVGGVWQPKFLPGLTISSDYYNVQVNNVITSVTAQNILNLCYDSPTLNNPFCPLFQRAGAGGGPRGEEAFRVIEGSLLQSSANFAKLIAQGVDTNIAYNHRFNWGTVSATGVWTHVFRRSNFTNPATPTFENVIVSELGDPRDAFNISVDLKLGKFTLGYGFRWLSGMYLNTYEDYNPLNGQPPQNADFADVKLYPVVTYSDVRIGYDVNDRFNTYLGVTNLGDTQPPYGLTGVGSGSAIYDNRGRYMFVGVIAKF